MGASRHARPGGVDPIGGVPRSAVTGIRWPAVAPPAAAAAQALQFQLEATQWWPPRLLREWQLRQLALLLRHAIETVPWYQERYRGFDPGAALDDEAFARLPLLRRPDIQEAGARLLSAHIPPEHGPLGETMTAGSTGHPVRVTRTDFVHRLWQAFTLRDHAWQGRDLGGRLAVIRNKVVSGVVPGWGGAAETVYPTGPAALLDIGQDPSRQLDWLAAQAPHYLVTFPTNLRELARLALERGVALPGLRQVVTYGEMLHPGLRALCRQAWGVPLADFYSAEEVGHIALQCPQHEHYHVQAEGLIVEVLDEAGRPCAQGEIGRVVVTDLHNFAMPLIRYVLGDYAEVGEPCPCGRGLPVLERILGRQRNMVALPDGTRHWPRLPEVILSLPVRRRRVVQKTLERIEVTLEVTRPLTADEERKLVEGLREALGHPFQVALGYVERLQSRSDAGPASFKSEDFVSEVTGGPAG